MTVLVTGGAGYIRSHMAHALVDAGERVVVLDNLATGFDWAVAQGASLVIGDVGDQPRVAALIAEHRVDAIIHFAASRARGDRDSKASLGRRLRGCVRRPAGRGRGTDRGGFRPCLFFAQMAAGLRRPASHRASRAGMGAQAFDARRLTFANSSIPLEKRSHLAAIAFPGIR